MSTLATIPFLAEPLMKAGKINPDFMPCLNEALNSRSRTYDRLAHDPEWNTPRLVHFREITAAFAHWSIRQINCGDPADDGPAHPPKLETVLAFLTGRIRSNFNAAGFKRLSLCDVSQMLYEAVYEKGCRAFDDWNSAAVLGAYYLDLDALLHNVCLAIRTERRENDAHDRSFDEAWAQRDPSYFVE